MSRVTDADRWNTLCELVFSEDIMISAYNTEQEEFVGLSPEDALDIPDRILAGGFDLNALEESFR